jgi:hypothetical protein
MAKQKFDLKTVQKRDVLVGVVILAALIVAILLLVKPAKKTAIVIPTPRPQERVEDRFNLQIPDNIEKTELVDVSGGTGGGIATRTEILADLADPETGKFYQAWLEKDGKLVSLGKLRLAKGGWLIEYNSANYAGYNKVVVSLETKFDSVVETKILEGSFK